MSGVNGVNGISAASGGVFSRILITGTDPNLKGGARYRKFDNSTSFTSSVGPGFSGVASASSLIGTIKDKIAGIRASVEINTEKLAEPVTTKSDFSNALSSREFTGKPKSLQAIIGTVNERIADLKGKLKGAGVKLEPPVTSKTDFANALSSMKFQGVQSSASLIGTVQEKVHARVERAANLLHIDTVSTNKFIIFPL